MADMNALLSVKYSVSPVTHLESIFTYILLCKANIVYNEHGIYAENERYLQTSDF
jgi:hypothetical protein